MVQTRLMRTAVLLATFVALQGAVAWLGTPPKAGVADAPDERSEWERFSERCASDSLRTLTAAEADFIEREPGCAVEDFWTADITRLYLEVPRDE